MRVVLELDHNLRDGELIIYKDGKLKSVEVRELLPELQEIKALKAQIQKNNENIIKLAQIIKEK